jgi:hypothetical protein
MSVTEVVVIDESRTVRDVPVMIVHHTVSVPIGSPVMPTPAEAAEYTDSNTQAEHNARAIDIEARNSIPPRVVLEGRPIDIPRIVFRHVNNFRIRRLNRDRLAVRRD